MSGDNKQTTQTHRENFNIRVEPVCRHRYGFDELSHMLLQHPRIKEIFRGKSKRLLRIQFAEHREKLADGAVPQYHNILATFYNYTDDYTVLVEGDLDDGMQDLKITRSAMQPEATAAELQEALEIVNENRELYEKIKSGKYVPHAAMPGVKSSPYSDGRTKRLVAIGLKPVNKWDEFEIVGVDLANREIVRDDDTFDNHTDALIALFQPIKFLLFPTEQYFNTNDHVWITLSDIFGNELWSMEVVRPAASSARNGSGLELRYVNYKGRRVLYRSHIPILNVLYDNGVQYRDWQNSESPFHAVGTYFKDGNGNPLTGFMYCSQPPTTIFDTHSEDPNDFRGVAFYLNNDGSIFMCSMMMAGWYRYYMGYTFRLNGKIEPRVGFTTNQNNQHAGARHFHHAYFRFDFDIGSSYWSNRLIENYRYLDFAGWPAISLKTEETEMHFEYKTYRAAPFVFFGMKNWKIMDNGLSHGYEIVPRSTDGTAANDAYGKGDLWFLHYHYNELDDGGSSGDPSYPTMANIDKFLNGEAVSPADIVVWYAVHFLHDQTLTQGEKDFGPDLYPLNW